MGINFQKQIHLLVLTSTCDTLIQYLQGCVSLHWILLKLDLDSDTDWASVESTRNTNYATDGPHTLVLAAVGSDLQ